MNYVGLKPAKKKKEPEFKDRDEEIVRAFLDGTMCQFELADFYGLTPQRVQQILRKAIPNRSDYTKAIRHNLACYYSRDKK